MAIEAQTQNFTSTTVAQAKVYKTGASTALTATNNTLTTAKVQTAPTKIAGKSSVVAVNVDTAFASNGTAATGATASLTLVDNHYTLAGTTGTTPALTIETASATRTFFQDKSGTAGTATFTFDKAPTVGQSLAVTMAKPDGTTVTKAFKVAVVGTTNGTLDGSFVQFATYDSGSVGDSAQATDAANNFKAAFESDNGFGDSTNGAIGRCYANKTDTTEGSGTTAGRVIMQATRPGTATNTNITPTATAASATFTFSDKPNETSTITLTDTDGTAFVFEIDNENNGVTGSNIAVNGIAAAGGGATGTAADLVAKINAQATLDITATNPSAGKVDLVQGATGTASNKTITVNDASHWNASCSVNVPAAFTGGVAWDDGCSVNVPATFTGGVDDTASLAQAEVNIAHSGRWAAYKLKEAISHATNGLGNYGMTATNVNNVVTMTSDIGVAGNSQKISYNATWPQLSTVLPPSSPSGGTDAVLPNLAYRLSLDGVTYTDWTEVVSDVKANVAGLKLGTMSIPDNVPYVQFGFNTNGGNLGSKSGSVSFEFVGGS